MKLYGFFFVATIVLRYAESKQLTTDVSNSSGYLTARLQVDNGRKSATGLINYNFQLPGHSVTRSLNNYSIFVHSQQGKFS